MVRSEQGFQTVTANNSYDIVAEAEKWANADNLVPVLS